MAEGLLFPVLYALSHAMNLKPSHFMPFNLYCVLYFQWVYGWERVFVCVQAIPVTLLDTSHTFIYALATMAVTFLNIPFCDVCIAVNVCNLRFCALCGYPGQLYGAWILQVRWHFTKLVYIAIWNACLHCVALLSGAEQPVRLVRP
jgi:hypothetical protein